MMHVSMHNMNECNSDQKENEWIYDLMKSTSKSAFQRFEIYIRIVDVIS